MPMRMPNGLDEARLALSTLRLGPMMIVNEVHRIITIYTCDVCWDRFVGTGAKDKALRKWRKKHIACERYMEET